MIAKIISKPLLIAISSLLLTGLTFAFSGESPSKSSTSKYEAGYTYRQCNGITKAGKRCKRGVSNANDTKCYQHK